MAQKVDLAAKLVHAVLQCGAHELYETLRIGRDASREAIQQAYKSCARDVHPDRNGAPRAEEAFKKVAHARDVLLDAARRATHDAELDSAAIPQRAKRRPCERRADGKRRAREAARAEASEAEAEVSDGGLSDEETYGNLWGSWQERYSWHGSDSVARGAKPHMKPGKCSKRRAASKARAAPTVDVSLPRGGGGAGRGHLGKRPWRRAARAAAKQAAKAAKSRTKARQHLHR